MIGRQFLHYKIIEKLGADGMGVVFKAGDTRLKRPVAIKFLPPDVASSPDARKRFVIEAQAAAAVNHANISQIHAIEELDGETFIVMEFVEGNELRQLPRWRGAHARKGEARGIQKQAFPGGHDGRVVASCPAAVV